MATKKGGNETDGLSLREHMRRTTRQIETDIIRAALERNRWNRRRTAAALKISYRSLMYKMKIGNLRDDDSAGEIAAPVQGIAEKIMPGAIGKY